MWHDNETTTDYLNFGVVADACAKLLQQANGQPISIGVSGGWGVGKSSLVRMVASRLNVDADPDKNTYVVVTFNPWLYQDFEGARSALLQMVGDEVLRRAAADDEDGLADAGVHGVHRDEEPAVDLAGRVHGPRQEKPNFFICGCCMNTCPRPPMTTDQARVWATSKPNSQATPAPSMMMVFSSEVARAGARKWP